MPAYHVERSIKIDAPEDKVRAAIEDFNEWPKWSPWLCMEPETKLTYHGSPGQIGHGYDWDGQIVGAGSMRIDSIQGSRQDMTLEFLKPFKSKAEVGFEVASVGSNQTEAKWLMDGNLPFFMFWMVNMMKAWIGMDYERGLRMLKEYVETGTVKSKSEFVGVVDVPAMFYVGVEDRCAIKDLGESMKKTLPQAYKYATENNLDLVGPPGSVYNNFDIKNQHCHYTAITPVKSEANIDGAICGKIEACKAIKVVHTGSYDHLGNGWGTAMTHQRVKKLKPLKSQSNFELYMNDPGETPEEDVITEIYIPVRS